MNILPKKRWHVRTKENIARVRRDEAEAAEKERLEKQRIENADREARLSVLKHKSKLRLEDAGVVEQEPPATVTQEHINLFDDLEHAVTTTNKEHDKETKDKTEEYEKKIGYLTYLGQDTNEALKKKNWYEVAPEEARFSRSNDIKDTYEKLVLKDADGKPKSKDLDIKDGEIAWKAKQRLDPLNAFKKYCPQFKAPPPKPVEETTVTVTNKDYTNIKSSKSYKSNGEKHKHKSKKKKHKKDKEDKLRKLQEKEKKLQKLREARLKRELQEKQRTAIFLTGINPTVSKTSEENVTKVKRKYNSQFNPELARQNYR